MFSSAKQHSHFYKKFFKKKIIKNGPQKADYNTNQNCWLTNFSALKHFLYFTFCLLEAA